MLAGDLPPAKVIVFPKSSVWQLYIINSVISLMNAFKTHVRHVVTIALKKSIAVWNAAAPVSIPTPALATALLSQWTLTKSFD